MCRHLPPGVHPLRRPWPPQLHFESNQAQSKFTVTPQQMSMRHLPMTWFCEMANSVIGEGGKLLEYKQLIANPKTWAMWTHSHGNKIGCLAQGMPGCKTGTNTIIFIKKDQVPKARAIDMTYGLITCLVWPEKLTNLTGQDWSREETGHITPETWAHTPPTYSPSRSSSTASSQQLVQNSWQ